MASPIDDPGMVFRGAVVLLLAAAACNRPSLGVRAKDAGMDVGTADMGSGHGGPDAGLGGDARADGDAAPADAPLEVGFADASGSDAAVETGPSDGGRVPYKAIAVTTGELHACVILDDHNVKCWGENAYGQLGYGDTRNRGSSPAEMGDALPIVDLGSGRTATRIVAGRYATCAILDDGSVKCWGWGGLTGVSTTADGGVGPPATGDHLLPLDFGGRKATHVAIAQYVACGSMEDDTLWCWGESTVDGTPMYEGKRARGKVEALSEDAVGSVFALFEDGSIDDVFGGHYGYALTAGGRKAVAIGGSIANRTCALFDDGTAACLEGGGTLAFGVPVGTVALGIDAISGECTLGANGAVRCARQGCETPASVVPSWCPRTAPDMPLGQPAVAITGGGEHFSCALLADGGVKCWGGDATHPPPPWLGAEFGAAWTDAGAPSTWPEVDLGTHPSR